MKPSDELIEKFRKLYYEEFKEEISKQEAYEKFMRVVNLVRIIIRPKMKAEEDEKILPHESYITNQGQ